MVWLSLDPFPVLLEGVHVYIEKLDFFWSFSLLYNIVSSLAALLIVRIVFRCLFMASRSVFMVSCSDLGFEGLWFRSLNLCSISCVLISCILLILGCSWEEYDFVEINSFCHYGLVYLIHSY